VVGRYAIHGKIASGGMATVHIGRLAGAVGFSRTVAIKRLHAHLASDEQFVLMFIDEARIAARIHHPNVVQTLDVVSAGEELLLVMDYVPGESLSHLMHAATAHGRGAPPRIVAAVMCGVLHGLDAAHEARDENGAPLGIVHRDVSPQNVLVGLDGIPRLLDFGVASAVGRVQSTRSGTLKGKLSYMAPERVRGDAADRRSDIYAAAVLAWEMLTGKRLFRGEDETQVLARVVEGWTEPPSAHAVGLSTRFDAAVMRGLAMEPSHRFGTAAEMARALEACEGLASPSEVGEWVRSLVGDKLEERARAIARVESQSGSMPAMNAAAATAAELPQEDVLTAVSDVRSSPSTSAPISARLRVAARSAQPAVRAALNVTIPTGPALTVGALAIAVGIVLATVLVLRSHSTPSSPPAASSAGAAATGSVEPGASAPSAPSAAIVAPSFDVDDLPLASAAASASAASAASAGATATPPASAAPHPLPRWGTTPGAAAPAKTRASCDPPYFFDADGVKHYKRECN
jgi:serine/threonine-protein kinase